MAFEPVGLVLLSPIAVAGFVLTTSGLPPARAWVPGLAFGAAFCFPLMWWMRAVGWDAWIGLSSLEAAFYAVLASAGALVRSRLRSWPLWLPVLWVTMETVRSTWPFSGMPWGRLAFAVADTPAASALPYLGCTGVGLLLAGMGTGLAWAVLTGSWRRLGVVGAIAAVFAVTSWLPFGTTVTGSVTVAAVQGNVPGDGSDVLLDPYQLTENHADATVALAADRDRGLVPAPDFVVWPENSTAMDPFEDVAVHADIERAVAAIGVPILVGAMVNPVEDGHILNQGIVWDPLTQGGERYTKLHPVPFGEYIPWRGLFDGRTFGKLRLIPRDMMSGTRISPLPIAGVQVADAICFDVAYDDGLYAQVADGAELIVVQTSNAMFIHTHQVDQQFEISRVRAIETGRTLVVAATNGVSGIIGPDGAVLSTAPLRTQRVLVQTVGLSDQPTWAVRMGLLPARLLAGLALAVVLVALFNRPSRRRSPAENTAPVRVLEPAGH